MEHSGGAADLDRFARMVRRALGVPTALVTLVEHHRQVFLGAVGLEEPWASTRETPLSHSVCQYVVADRAAVVIPDTRTDPRLVGNRAPIELDVVAYAGWPLTDHLGRVVGSLCAIDSVPREWTRDELDALADIAGACSTQLAEQLRRTAALVDLEESERYAERGRVLLLLSEALSSTRSLGDIAAAVRRATSVELGCSMSGLWLLRDLADLDRIEIAGRTLRWLAEPGEPVAEAMTELPVDASHPGGVALQETAPVFCTGRDELVAAYPHLAEVALDGEARAFLPLVLGDRPLGVMVLVWPTRMDFDAEDRVTMAALCAYTAQAVQRAALLEERVSVSVTLQQAMLTDLATVSDLEVVARYRPAATREQVGGDWYDAVALPSGATMLAVGDVVGHDIVAATQMSQLRSMLRALVCSRDETPAQSLRRLDQIVAQLSLATMASVVLAVVEPVGARWRVTWSSAGHLPALLVHPTGDVGVLGAGIEANDALIGVDPATTRRDHVAEVDAGTVVLLYTDGLVERRGELLDDGIERLRGRVREQLGPLQDLVDEVIAAQVGGHPGADDVVLLAACLGSTCPVASQA